MGSLVTWRKEKDDICARTPGRIYSFTGSGKYRIDWGDESERKAGGGCATTRGISVVAGAYRENEDERARL